jgi:hypothetical protein
VLQAANVHPGNEVSRAGLFIWVLMILMTRSGKPGTGHCMAKSVPNLWEKYLSQ